MITLCIQYQIDRQKLSEFEQYARNWPEPIRRCGGRTDAVAKAGHATATRCTLVEDRSFPQQVPE